MQLGQIKRKFIGIMTLKRVRVVLPNGLRSLPIDFKKFYELNLNKISTELGLRKRWSKSTLENLIFQYRAFLYIKYKYPEEVFAPTDDVDQLWHEHILHTEKYFLDCEYLFGKYLHHKHFEKCQAKIIQNTILRLNENFPGLCK